MDDHTIPLRLCLDERPCLVVGGGEVACRKVEWLLERGAAVEVVSLAFCTGLTAPARSPVRLRLTNAAYSSRDLAGYLLVIAATDDREVNVQVAADARRAGIPVNVVDVPDLCSFYVPASVRRGPIEVTIGTGGAAPALAGRLRRDIEAAIPPWYAAYARALGRLREWLRGKTADIDTRSRILKALASRATADRLADLPEEAMRERLQALAEEELGTP